MGSSMDLSLSDATEGQSLAREPFLGGLRGVVAWCVSLLACVCVLVVTYSRGSLAGHTPSYTATGGVKNSFVVVSHAFLR